LIQTDNIPSFVLFWIEKKQDVAVNYLKLKTHQKTSRPQFYIVKLLKSTRSKSMLRNAKAKSQQSGTATTREHGTQHCCSPRSEKRPNPMATSIPQQQIALHFNGSGRTDFLPSFFERFFLLDFESGRQGVLVGNVEGSLD
jgi:hypothetical protein